MAKVLELASEHSATNAMFALTKQSLYGSESMATYKPITGRIGNANYKHGATRALNGKSIPEYHIWTAMRQRCLKKTNPQYFDYGGRGITICEEWDSFSKFLEDMGLRPDGTTLERKDVNGNYCKENCCWATRKQQTRNRRETVRVEYKGSIVALADVCEEHRVNYRMVSGRMRAGWSLSSALATPKIEHKQSLVAKRAMKCG